MAQKWTPSPQGRPPPPSHTVHAHTHACIRGHKSSPVTPGPLSSWDLPAPGRALITPAPPLAPPVPLMSLAQFYQRGPQPSHGFQGGALSPQSALGGACGGESCYADLPVYPDKKTTCSLWGSDQQPELGSPGSCQSQPPASSALLQPQLLQGALGAAVQGGGEDTSLRAHWSHGDEEGSWDEGQGLQSWEAVVRVCSGWREPVVCTQQRRRLQRGLGAAECGVSMQPVNLWAGPGLTADMQQLRRGAGVRAVFRVQCAGGGCVTSMPPPR